MFCSSLQVGEGRRRHHGLAGLRTAPPKHLCCDHIPAQLLETPGGPSVCAGSREEPEPVPTRRRDLPITHPLPRIPRRSSWHRAAQGWVRGGQRSPLPPANPGRDLGPGKRPPATCPRFRVWVAGGFLGQGRQEGKKREHGKGLRGYGAVLFIKENQTMQALN